MSNLPTPAALDAVLCLEALDNCPGASTGMQQVAVAVAQVHATLAVAEAIDALRAHAPAGFVPPWAE